MGLIALLVAGFLHFWLSFRIDYWTTLDILGFKSELPVAFIQSPHGYRLLNIIFGIIVLCSPLLGGLEIYVGVVACIFVWLSSGVVGRNKAYERYRQIMREMVSIAETDEEGEEYRAYASKSNSEIAEMVEQFVRAGR